MRIRIIVIFYFCGFVGWGGVEEKVLRVEGFVFVLVVVGLYSSVWIWGCIFFDI